MKQLSLLLSFLFLLFSLGACSMVPEVVVQETQPRVEKTLPQAAAEVDAGPIRIWAPDRDGYHPLRGGDPQNRAIDRLLYDSLYTFTDDGLLVPVLAREAVFNAAGTRVTIQLRTGISFHGGAEVNAYDVVRSLETFLTTRREALGLLSPLETYLPDQEEEESGNGAEAEPEDNQNPLDDSQNSLDDSQNSLDDSQNSLDDSQNSLDDSQNPLDDSQNSLDDSQNSLDDSQSLLEDSSFRPLVRQERDLLNAIVSVQVLDLSSLQIQLSERCDNLLTILTFPILEAAAAGSLFAPYATGTGSHRIYQGGEGRLDILPQTSTGRALEVRILPDAKSAMSLFQEGELDLLLLSADEYAIYGGRQSLRLQTMPLRTFIYLRLNADSGLFADQQERDDLLQLFSWKNTLLDQAASQVQRLALPVALNDRRLPFDPYGDFYRGEVSQTANVKKTLRFYKASSTFDDRLGENLRLLLERFGYDVELVGEDQPWDLALEHYDFISYPDAHDFFAFAADGRFAAVLQEQVENADRLLAARSAYDRVQSLSLPLSEEEREDYARAVRELFSGLPLVGVAAPTAAVVFARRVTGLLAPEYDHPYAGLEDLVLWPQP